MPFDSSKEFYEATIGKKFDVDGAYGAQCWDYFAYFNNAEKLGLNCHCSLTRYAGDIYKLHKARGYDEYFDDNIKISDLRNGDWIFWDQHVAMYYDGMEVGQNQGGHPEVTGIRLNQTGIIGILRYKKWNIGKWMKNEKGWWFEYPDGSFEKNAWKKIENEWYYFDEKGYAIRNTWRRVSGKWYFFNDDCHMVTGWVDWKGKKCYCKSDGSMAYSWEKIDGDYYYFDKEGYMVTDKIVPYGDEFYYIRKDGKMSRNEKVTFTSDAKGVLK